METFTTPLVLRSSNGQLWNIDVVSEGGNSGNLTFNANRPDGGETRLSINDVTGSVNIGGTFGGTLSVNGGGGIGVIASSTTSAGVFGSSRSNGGVFGNTTGNGAAIIGLASSSSTGLAGDFNGNVRITGRLITATSGFSLDSPLDPADKFLNHASINSSEMLNVYSGNTTLDKNGEAWVDLPEWVEALNHNFRYQLTCIGQSASVYIAEEISNNHFKIAGGNPGTKISWQLTGVRQDSWAKANPLIVEEAKPENEQGYYQHPQLYGQSEDRSINAARYPEMMSILEAEELKQLQEVKK